MKLQYYADTDTLSIGLQEALSVETSEIAPDVTVDYDADGNVVSIDFDLASQKVDLSSLKTLGLSLQRDRNLQDRADPRGADPRGVRRDLWIEESSISIKDSPLQARGKRYRTRQKSN